MVSVGAMSGDDDSALDKVDGCELDGAGSADIGDASISGVGLVELCRHTQSELKLIHDGLAHLVML